MEIVLRIDGKEIQLTEEQINALGIKPQKSIFDRVNKNDVYYIIDDYGTKEINERNDKVDARWYEVANYCTDKDLMQRRALEEVLNRQLWRESIKAGELKNPWNGISSHYSIAYNAFKNIFETVLDTQFKMPGMAYFPTRKAAEDALKNIVKPFFNEHKELV